MPALSPRTQQLQAGMDAGPDQETALFEQGMSEMAYNLLSSRMPDVLQDVVTFKVISTDLDKGAGVGAFVVLRHDQPLYIPVVMVDNAIKPLDIFYHKALNVFLPLTKSWLEELDKTSLASLGSGVKTPDTLYTDVDIRNVVVPPITGRFSYASWVPKALVDVDRVIDSQTLEKVATERPLMLPSLLAQSPNGIKKAYVRFLEQNPRMMKQAAATYGVSKLAAALQPRLEKVAAKQQYGGALWIVDKDNSPTDFRRIFGDKAGEAYTGVRKKGFAAKDERLVRNMAVQEQPYDRWIEPKQPGVYCLYNSQCEEHYAFVMPNPIDLFDEGTRYGRRPAVPGHNPLVDNSYYDPESRGSSNRVYPYGRPDEGSFATRRSWNAKPFLATFSNGDYIEPDRLVGRDSIADDVNGQLHARLFENVSGEPKVGKGFFVRQRGTTFQATVPMEIKSVTTLPSGRREVRAMPSNGVDSEIKTIATDPAHPYNTIWMPKGADIVYMPADFVWIPLKNKLNEKAWFQSALDLQACVSSMLSNVGAKKVSIKDAGARQFSVDGSLPMDKVAALKKLAYAYVISVDDAEALLTKAASDRKATAWVASPRQLAQLQLHMNKLAAAGDPQQAAPQDPSQDPSLGAQAAQAAQPPAPPSPVELAAMEMDQQIQQEMQRLSDKKQMLAALVQRSSEIAGGAPPSAMAQSQAMGAPPPSQNMVTGAPMPPGVMGGGQPGMDPSMMGQPGMDPSMMGQPGMDPSMMGQPGMDQSGMDPSQQMPGALMPAEGPNAQNLPQEVNPQFLDQAAQLQSADMFDAAAVATLAQSPALQNVVAQYLPNLEKAVDNLGRVLLTLWMQEADLRPQIGEETFTGIEDSMQTTFKGMGDLVLRLSRGVQAVKGPDDRAA